MTKITYPIMRYHGAKFRLAPWVISHFPEHKCYVEPFGGAAGVLIQKPQSYAEVYNDLDDDVVNLFKVLRCPEQNLQLRELCALTPYSRKDFELAFEPCEEPLEKARRMVVRATMGFGSAAATGGTSGFRTDTKRKYATAMHLWQRYPDNLSLVCKRLQSVLVEHKPAIEVMRKHDGEETLHYCDPPYVPESRVKGNRYYQHEMTAQDHESLLKSTLELKGMIIISGYDSELYNDYLSSWRKEEKSARISAGRGTGKRVECLWISPSCQNALNDEIPF
ncbi:DNA adenine methylase [Vibrio aestuarianus]|uniref:Site-specific DNA-methyltransferase (Adenine-specific) n=1 Tax=Vibrio aestuarianus TaxID=28171 RepID=A0ABM9FS52_9VIBR|nr:DNA adenine methylase [Vibrio aestuarianus]MDE1213786.1 DNA adenine methylase [Vibrio aestuarianus]MDE1217243.1 DNA adenine methylase [Vibrio aestuarianus]MDE1256984.1 DNA adenine methylase [Vibrio aestuarianus]MDE1260784.1 DNA adenine methylase [Vibrio aestuarianus]MDE1267580.1 DNA adenine methylase [Vibrio aestuarianus]